MTVTIKAADLIESVADALQFISYYHPMDYIRALGKAYRDVVVLMKQHDIPMRTAAYMIAMDRVASAERLRGGW